MKYRLDICRSCNALHEMNKTEIDDLLKSSPKLVEIISVMERSGLTVPMTSTNLVPYCEVYNIHGDVNTRK